MTPRGLDRAAAYAWRLLVVGAAVAAVAWLLAQLRPVVIAAVLAAFLTSLLAPVARWLGSGLRIGAGPASALALAGALLGFAAVWAFLVPAFVGQLGELGTSLEQGARDLTRWLARGPLDVSSQELDGFVDRAVDQLSQSGGTIAGGLFSGALLVLEVIGALLLAVVAAFFLIRDGEQVWRWVVGVLPPTSRPHLAELGSRSWDVVGSYLRGVSIVAAFDAVLIGLALVLLDVPAALPLATLTFMGAFIPFLGATVAGALAALVALVSQGALIAIVVVGVVILIQQLEGNLLYPVVVGRSVELHPLASLLAIAAGGVLAGILGAIVAIPVAAAVGQWINYSRELGEADPARFSAGAGGQSSGNPAKGGLQ